MRHEKKIMKLTIGYKNAERIAKEIIQKEIKKIFK